MTGLRKREPLLCAMLDEQRTILNKMLVSQSCSSPARQELEESLLRMVSIVSRVWTEALSALWTNCEPIATWAARSRRFDGGGR